MQLHQFRSEISIDLEGVHQSLVSLRVVAITTLAVISQPDVMELVPEVGHTVISSLQLDLN